MANRERREDEEPQRYRLMEEMEENRDRRERRALRGSGYGDRGPGGLARHDPYGREERYRPGEWDEWGQPMRRGGAESRPERDFERRSTSTAWPSEPSGWPATSHRGRGPRGYKRSDARIADDINDRLTDDRYIDATEIQVEVKDGEVTLTGNVDSRAARRRRRNSYRR